MKFVLLKFFVLKLIKVFAVESAGLFYPGFYQAGNTNYKKSVLKLTFAKLVQMLHSTSAYPIETLSSGKWRAAEEINQLKKQNVGQRRLSPLRPPF